MHRGTASFRARRPGKPGVLLVAGSFLALAACSSGALPQRGAAFAEFDPNAETFTSVPVTEERTMALGSFVMVNRTAASVRLESIWPVEYDRSGIRFLGMRTYRKEENPLGGWEIAACGYPPEGRVHYPVLGFDVGPGETIGLYAGVQSLRRPGLFPIRDVQVTYTTGGHRRWQRLRFVVGLKVTADVDYQCDPRNRPPPSAPP